MSVTNQRNWIKWLYTQGKRDYEIREATGISLIFIKHTIARIVATDPAAESKHYINRRKKGRLVNATIVNNDPHFEEVDRFVVG